MMPTHPALEALRLDEFQRAAAFTDETAVVTAGAGAGKTRALVGRYLYIMLEKGIGPDRILALTFTRKAAAEMFQRVHQTLVSPKISRHDLAGRLSGAHIQTLDSFCREIVAGAAERYGYTPDFSIDENACVRAATKAAYRYVLANQRAPGLRELLDAFGYEAVVRELFASFGAANVEPHWLGRRVCRESARLGELEFERTARVIVGEIGDIAARIMSLAQGGAAAGFKDGVKQAVRAAAAFQAQLPEIESLRAFIAFLQTPDNAINLRSVGKSDIEKSIKELAKKLRDEKRLKKVSQLLDFERFLPEYRAVMDRLDEYSDALCEDKRRANVMNYRDLGALAVDTLESDEDYRRYWQAHFDYILIDEFQDNNDLQKRLLLLLSGAGQADTSQGAVSGRGKLFFVGDEKQSIYLFRGADVSVFKSLAPELGASRFALARNYRSARSLIEFFNASFPSVMAPLDAQAGGGHRPFEASYEAMEVGGGDFASHIEYHCVTSNVAIGDAGEGQGGGSLLNSKESMAFRTALWIKNAVDSASPLFVRGEDQQPRAARYDDIAVLMRTMSRQYELEKYLRMFGIPFSTDTSTSMFAEEPINDLYFALRLALDPEDSFATAAVLRSPLCGLSDDGYASLLAAGSNLKKLIAEIPEALSATDRERLRGMVTFYEKLESSIDHLPLMELCDFVWSQGGLETSALSDPARLPYLEHWNAARAIASDLEARGGQLQALLYELRAYMRKERAFESNAVPKRESRGLRLMTIHKSKGLEFPIVVIPWMEAGASKRQGDELWGVLEGEDATGERRRFFTADIGFHDRIEGGSNVLQTQARELRLEKERAETKRLLYVACTRAIDHLIMFDAAPARAYDADSFRALLLRGTERWSGSPEPQQLEAHPHLAMIDFSFEPLASEREIAARRAASHATSVTQAGEAPEIRAAGELSGTRAPAPTPTASAPAEGPRAAPRTRTKLTVTAFNLAVSKDPVVKASAQALAAGIIRQRIFEPRNSAPSSTSELASTEYGTLVHELFAHLASGRSLASFQASQEFSQETPASLSPGTRSRAAAQLAPLFESAFFRSLAGGRAGTAAQGIAQNGASRAETERVRGAEVGCARGGALKFEFPFLLRLSPWVVEGRMDMLADLGDELLVLDLKTDQRYAPHEYALQLALYTIASRKLFPGKRIRAGLVYLSFGEIAWLKSDVTEDALLRICPTISYNHTQY